MRGQASRSLACTRPPSLLPPCRCLLRGQTARLEVTAGRSLVLEEYADIKALGRIALREGGRTVAVGVVTRLIE